MRKMHPTNALGYLLQHVSSILAKQSDQVLQERLGIGFSQFKILMALQWNPATGQRQIADALGQTEASISRQIALMHDRGLLSTSINPKNRRQHLTTLTSKGLQLSEAALESLHNFHEPTFSALNPKQRGQLLEHLTILHQQACSEEGADTCHDSLYNLEEDQE